MDITATLKRGFLSGLSLTWDMIKVIVPFYLLVELAKHLGLINLIGGFFRPFMDLFGLPGESALALIAGYTANLYAAIAVLTPLHLSSREVTIIAIMLGISHSLPVETSITRKAGANAWLLLFVRLFLSFFVGMVVNLLWKSF
jgi:hypothetical protein